jgi:hypothetical protein
VKCWHEALKLGDVKDLTSNFGNYFIEEGLKWQLAMKILVAPVLITAFPKGPLNAFRPPQQKAQMVLSNPKNDCFAEAEMTENN